MNQYQIITDDSQDLLDLTGRSALQVDNLLKTNQQLLELEKNRFLTFIKKTILTLHKNLLFFLLMGLR